MKRTILLSIIALAAVISTNATTRYVKTDGTGSAASATTWATASNDLQAVIIASIAGDEIRVAAGTYKPNSIVSTDGINPNPTTSDPRDNAFVLKEGVKIYGGFTTFTNGGAIPAFGSTGRNGVSTLSGDIDNDGTLTGNAYHIIIGAAPSANPITAATVLDGFTVTGGNADGGSSSISVNGINFGRYHGGGINNGYSSPTLINVTVSGNSASYIGGGIYNGYSSPTLTNVTVSGNTAANGGGISNIASSPTLTNVTVSGNTASNSGGGIYNNNLSSPQIYNSILWGNTVANGANVYNGLGSTPTYKNSLVEGTSGGWTNFGTDNGNNIDADPLFVDWQDPASVSMPNTDGNYRLSSGSPAIGAGNNADYTGGVAALATATDLAGNPRRFGNNIDMGAYEADAYLATFRFGSPRPDSIAGFASPYLLTAPSSDPERTGYTFGG